MAELIAGKELDVLIEEKVMGYVPFISRYDYFGEPKTPEIICPNYSTDIAAAWRVAEIYQLWVFPIYANNLVHWYAGKKSTWGENNDLPIGVVDVTFRCLERANTPMLAICKAALALVFPDERGVIGLTRGTSPT